MSTSIKTIFICLSLLFVSIGAMAQTNKKTGTNSAKDARARTDSIANARKEALEAATAARKKTQDSTKAAREALLKAQTEQRKHFADSLAKARKHKTDSTAKARKKITDSTAAIRKYKTSKKYTDSVTKARNKKLKAVQKERTAKLDSVQDARKKIMDSITTVRQARTDSVRTRQKNKTDSLAKVNKYKASKRYADSVTLVKRHRSDSIKFVQQTTRDSIAKVRKHTLDSAKTARLHIMDSTKAVRTKFADSLKMVRKAKTDSLTKKKEAKEKIAKTNEKKKQESMKLKLELKLKQKREEWSNKSMLKKNWGPIRRTTQNSFTHYNYYFNANRKMEEAELNMRRVNKENYDSLIGLFPFNPNKDSTLLAADMDSIVHKVSVGIQIHDPRVKWSNDMYLLLGQAYYYKGNYENASIAFRYIISNKKKDKKGKSSGRSSYYARPKTATSIVEKKKKSKLGFLKHKSVHNDALLWLARTYVTAGKIENGESVISLLEFDHNLPDNLTGRLAVEKAFAYLEARNYTEASKQLYIAVDDDNLPEWLRLRMAFLNGQILQNMGEYAAAATSYEEVLRHYPKIEMDFYTRKYIAYNKLMAGNAVADAMVPLKKMLKDNKYSSYYDQVYFVLGKLAAKANKNDEAITYLSKSTKTPKATKKQKALSFAALGDVYYTTANYANAKIAYDSSAKYAGSSSKDKTVLAAIQKSAGLNEIAAPSGTIKELDSLLELASLSKRDQQNVVKKYIRALEKKRDDSIFNAENPVAGALKEVTPDGTSSGGSTWYFANPALMAQGSADFKRKWGNRPLSDNWRRASAAPLAGSSKTDPGAASEDKDDDEVKVGKLVMRDGIPTEESLLATIPNTAAQKEQAIKTQQKAYILLAKAYVKQLSDYNQAIITLDTLNKRYPNHNQKEEELFLRYQIALKQNSLDKAQGYANELLTKFPKSQYASLLSKGNSESKISDEAMAEVAAYFDKTYELLMQRQYTEANMRAELGKTKYKHPVYKKRFEVVEAMAIAGSGDYDKADTLISKFIKNNPSDSLTTWAKSVKQYVGDVRSNNGKPSWYKEGPAVTAKPKEDKKVADSTMAAAKPTEPTTPAKPAEPEIPKMYAYHADSAHYCLIVLQGLDARTGKLKKAITSFDSAKYATSGLQTLIDLYKMDQGIVVVKNFTNAAAATKYLSDLNSSSVLSEYKPEEISTCIISGFNYKKMFADKQVVDYLIFYNRFYPR